MDDNTKDTTPAEEVVEETQEEQAPVEETSASSEPEVVEEVKAEEVKEEPKSEVKEEKPKKEVSASLEKIIESIEKLSVLELADLVKALEDRFGVSAAAPMAMAAAPAAGGSDAGPAEEQTSFNVILTSGGANKIAAIKAVRELVPTLGLKEAKDLVEAAPKPVLEGVNKATAEEAKAKLTEAGGTVELQ